MKNEFALLQAARTMNKDALVKIFDLYASRLYSYAMRFCGDPVLADHVVGDVFARLLEQLAAGNGPTSNLRSYLFEMVHHRIVDEVRYSQRRAPLDVLDSFASDTYSGSRKQEDRIILGQVLSVIQHDLTDDQRHVIVLRFLEGFNLRETADIIGKKQNHVRVIQNRALARLRKVFDSKEARTVRPTDYSTRWKSQAIKGPGL
jgi:RNA polymerase sigma-70 factor (ECF subfamily)